jgi:type IV pilus assembly protein PilB
MEGTVVDNQAQLGQFLVRQGAVTQEQIQEALRAQRETGHQHLLGEILVQKGYCSDSHIVRALSLSYGVPYARISPRLCDPRVFEILPQAFLEEHGILPLFRVHNTLTVAMSEPENLFLVDQIEQISGCETQVVCATDKDIRATLKSYSPEAQVFVADEVIDELELDHFKLVENQSPNTDVLAEAAGQSSVIQLVNYLLCDAVQCNASDIHIEPDEKSLQIRYRVDGKLYEKMRPSHQMHAAIVSRIRIMAELDITKRQVSQEGTIRVLIEESPVDLRVSIMPGICGEKVAIRIVNGQTILSSLETLGFTMNNLKCFRGLLESPSGLVLLTGPAGSGKGTTWYAALSELNCEQINICTVEDPVRNGIAGVNQFEVGSQAEGDVPTMLRGVLRQDPDIILVSEIHEQKTAKMAIKAALSGSLILSSLATPDATSAVTRLVDLGVPSYYVSDALVGVLAQRLVRKLCPHCKTGYKPSKSIRKVVAALGETVDTYYHATGCTSCRSTGFSGRIALHELFVPDDALRELIYDGTRSSILRAAAVQQGLISLARDGIEKIRAGIISVEEVLRTVRVCDID